MMTYIEYNGRLLSLMHRREVLYDEEIDIYYRIYDFSYTKNFGSCKCEFKIAIDILEREEAEVHNELKRLTDTILNEGIRNKYMNEMVEKNDNRS